MRLSTIALRFLAEAEAGAELYPILKCVFPKTLLCEIETKCMITIKGPEKCEAFKHSCQIFDRGSRRIISKTSVKDPNVLF